MAESIQILFLEDDTGTEKSVKTLLQNEGINFDLYRVTDRADIESNLSQKDYDFVFIDWDMDDIDGFDVITIVRNVDLIIPVIILSGALDEGLVVQTLHAGANDYIYKQNLSRLGPVVDSLYIANKYKEQTKFENIVRRKQKLRKEVEQRTQELEDANAYIHSVVNNLVDGIISIDTRGKIKNINKATTKIFGYDEEELLGQNITILMPEPYHSAHDGYLENYLSTGEAKILNVGRQVSGKRKNGEVFPLELSVIETKSHGVHYFTGLIRDISVRVALETELKNSQARFERGQEFANIGTWDWDIQSGDVYWSDRIAPLFGYPKGELETTYDNFLQAVHPDDKQFVIDAVNACIEKGVEYDIEHRCVWPDGTIRWLHEKGDVVRDENGTPLNMLGVVQDITNRKLTEEALAENTTLLKEAQHIGQIGNWSVNLTTDEITWSDEIYQILGYQSGDLEPNQERFYQSIHPDDLELVKQSEKEAISHHKNLNIDHRILLPDDQVRWVHLQAQPTYSNNKEAIKLSGTIQDISERKLNEEKLVQTNEILQQIASGDDIDYILDNVITGVEKLIDGASCNILVIDDNDKLHTKANKGLPEFFNYAFEGLKINQNEISAESSPFRFHRVIAQDISSNPFWKNFIDLTTKANIASCWSEPIRSLSRQPFGVLNIYFQKTKAPDFSELDILYNTAQLCSIALLREQNENSLKNALNNAKKANQAKSEFLSHMSHELRTPLNAIIGFSHLLELEENLDQSQIETIKEIHHAGNHLLDLINDILDLSLIETGNIEINKQEVNVCEIINECVSLVDNISNEKNISITTENCCLLDHAFIYADPKRLKQSILNLLSNAIKYNKKSGNVIISCVDHGNESVQINIEDTGHGISDENIKKLFTPFSRLDAKNSEIEGTGIGLVITKELVELMGGSILVKSVEGIGTTFTLTFNVAHRNSSSHDAIDQQKNDQKMTDISIPSKTIVYIEDNPVNLKVVSKAMQRLPGVELLSAMEPEQGITLVNESLPDLVLLDINLPGMSGFDVIKILRDNADTANIPVVALSASAMSSDQEKAKQAGFNDYITKPVNLAIFYNTLDKYLD